MENIRCESKKINFYMAIGLYVPREGESYNCFKVEFQKGEVPKFTDVSTSTIKSVRCIGGSIYEAVTLNSVYIVQVT